MQNAELTWKNIPNVAISVFDFSGWAVEENEILGGNGFLSSGGQENDFFLDSIYHLVV
jgi:hypothetical protein